MTKTPLQIHKVWTRFAHVEHAQAHASGCAPPVPVKAATLLGRLEQKRHERLRTGVG